MSTKRKATMLRLTEQDIAIIQQLKLHYGVTSSNEVVRMALRSALRELPTTQAPSKERALYPQP